MIQTTRCQVASHNSARINSICFNKKCQGKSACCQKCLIEFHRDHIEQSVDLDNVLKYIKTSSDQPAVPSPEIKQALIELTKAQNNLEGLQNIIKQETERLSAQSQQTICKNIGIRYNILEEQIQGLENQQWNLLAQDMIRDFEVQKGNIIIRHPFVNQLGEEYFKFMNELQQTVRNIVQDFKLIKQMVDQTVPNFYEKFSEFQVLTGHTEMVYGIDICKERNLLASGSVDKTVKLWNLENNALIQIYSQPYGCKFDVVFSNQGNLLAFGGGGDYSIRLIDITDLMKNNVLVDLKGHTNYICRLTFSNDSKYLISSSDDDKIIFWDVIQKKESFQLNLNNPVQGLAISSDDTIIASNSYDGQLRIWTIQSKELLFSQKKAHTIGAGVKFSNDQKMLVSSGSDGIIKLWNLQQSNQSQLSLIREFKAATKCIYTVLFSPCSNFIISISNEDREIKVISQYNGEVVQLFKSNSTNTKDIVQVAISTDMSILAYVDGKNIAVWKRK